MYIYIYIYICTKLILFLSFELDFRLFLRNLFEFTRMPRCILYLPISFA